MTFKTSRVTTNHQMHEQVHTISYLLHTQQNYSIALFPWQLSYCTLQPVYEFVIDQSETRYSVEYLNCKIFRRWLAFIFDSCERCYFVRRFIFIFKKFILNVDCFCWRGFQLSVQNLSWLVLAHFPALCVAFV